MTAAISFIIVAVMLSLLAVLAILGVTHVQLKGRDALQRDGLRPGSLAPAWALADSSGTIYRSPPSRPIQLLVFADNSLRLFPSVVDGLRELSETAAELEIVVLLRQQNDSILPTLRILGLPELPVLTGSESLYGRYNVRVMPFLIFVDSERRVRTGSLVNHDWQVTTLYRTAMLPVTPVDRVPHIFHRRRISQAEG
jgi:hypothetical protein